MSFNIRRLIIGGLLAGLVILVFNILTQYLLMDRVQQEMNAWIQGSADRISMSGGAIAAGIIMKFAIGIILVWLYAAIRPRFDSWLRTASCVTLVVWLLGAIFFSDFPLMGMISVSSYILLEIIQLLTLFTAVLAGAMFYSELGAQKNL